MTPSADVFRRIIGKLEAAGIPYMLTGSFASAYHGAPRATQDLDFVIAATASQLRQLTASLPKAEYYVNPDTALKALASESQFNVIDLETGWKVDLICRRSRPFSQTEFERRQTINWEGLDLAVATTEDLLLAKLEWAKLGDSLRQLEDVADLLRLHGQQLDLAYVEHWVDELGLDAQWKEAQRAAEGFGES